MNLRMCLFSAAIAALTATSLQAAVLYGTPESVYSQDFDALPNAIAITTTNTSLGTTANGAGWIDDTASPAANQISLLGWHAWHAATPSEGGVNGHQRMRISTGSSTVGAFYTYRNASGPNLGDRALGILNSQVVTGDTVEAADAGNGTDVYFGINLTNTTGVTLHQITVGYTGEQYRDGGADVPNAQSLRFQYSVGATSIQDTGYLSASALDFTSPTFTNTAGGATLTATDPANRTVIGPVTITGLNWGPNQDLWLRWADKNDPGNDHGLGIDDFSFSASAIPEPASMALAAMAALGVVRLRRRK